jgi:hypothetical protein
MVGYATTSPAEDKAGAPDAPWMSGGQGSPPWMGQPPAGDSGQHAAAAWALPTGWSTKNSRQSGVIPLPYSHTQPSKNSPYNKRIRLSDRGKGTETPHARNRLVNGGLLHWN